MRPSHENSPYTSSSEQVLRQKNSLTREKDTRWTEADSRTDPLCERRSNVLKAVRECAVSVAFVQLSNSTQHSRTNHKYNYRAEVLPKLGAVDPLQARSSALVSGHGLLPFICIFTLATISFPRGSPNEPKSCLYIRNWRASQHGTAPQHHLQHQPALPFELKNLFQPKLGLGAQSFGGILVLMTG